MDASDKLVGLQLNVSANSNEQNSNYKSSNSIASNITRYPPNALTTLIGEVNLLLTALRRNSRWASHTVQQVFLLKIFSTKLC